MDNIRHPSERKTDLEQCVDLTKTLEDLQGAYAAINAIETED